VANLQFGVYRLGRAVNDGEQDLDAVDLVSCGALGGHGVGKADSA
jgi:hypothetical protein